MKHNHKLKDLIAKFDNLPMEDDKFIISLNQAKKCTLICIEDKISMLNNMISINYHIREVYIKELQVLKQILIKDIY